MKLIKDKEFYKVSKEELNDVKGIKNTMKALKLSTINKPLFVLIIFLFIVNVALSALNALVAKEMLAIFTSHEFEKFTYFAFICLGLNVLFYLVDYAQAYYYDKFKKEITLNLKAKTFERINSLKASCFSANQTSTFSRRLNDANDIVNTFNIIFNTIQNIVISLAYCIVLAISSPVLFAICAVFYLIKSVIYKFIIPKHNVLRRRNRKTQDEAHNVALESIRGANDIKSLNLTTNMQESYYEKTNEFFSRNMSLGVWWRNRLMPTNFFAFALNSFVFMLLVAYFATNNIYSAGTILFFWTYRGHINTFFKNVFDIKENFSNVEVSASRMMELFDEDKYPSETFGTKDLPNFEGEIEFKNVKFSYEKGKPVLDGVSFKIEANKITALVGKTGCGKSTSLSLIARFYDTTKGTITIDGTNVKKLTKNCLRNNIGYVQQTPYIFNRTFKENLLLVKPDATIDEIMDACKKSEIHDFIMSTKDQYDTLIGENGITLSGGQRQRLSIARALLNNSKVIMFDESTSSLDNENQAKIQATIENLSTTHTIIVVAHRLSTIINADKIIFMDNHKVKAEGSHKELFETCPEYRALYEIENTTK